MVIAKLNEQNDVLNGFISKKDQTRNYLERIYESGEALDIMEVTNYKDYLGKIAFDIKDQEKVIEKTQYLLRFKQLEVTEALKELKVLEKLKETQERKFYNHVNYVEAKELDDIASTRFKKLAV